MTEEEDRLAVDAAQRVAHQQVRVLLNILVQVSAALRSMSHATHDMNNQLAVIAVELDTLVERMRADITAFYAKYPEVPPDSQS